MESLPSLKMRMIADGVMAFGFSVVVPIALAPIGKDWPTILMSSASFLLAAAFWFDLLRTGWQFQGKLPLN